MELQKEWLEVIIKRHQFLKGISQIFEAECEPATGKGDNYTSELVRVKLKAIDGDGKVSRISVLVKMLPLTELRAKQMKEFGLFKQEIMMFTEILPKMSNLMEEMDLKEEMWGNLIYFRPHDLLVLEDLKVYGYKMADRRQGFSLEDASFIISSLARFHAVSVILIEGGKLDGYEFMKAFLFDDRVQQYFDASIDAISKEMKDCWEPEWSSYADRIMSKLLGKATSRLREVFDVESKFKVLNHGDFWCNNMLLRRSIYDKRITSIKFVDFQISFIGSSAFDLLYFFTTSLKGDVFENNLDEILQVYLDSFHKTLELFSYQPLHTPTFEELKDEIERCALLPLVITLFLLPTMMSSPEDIPDFEEVMKEFEAEKKFDAFNFYKAKGFTDKAKTVMRWCKKCKALTD